MVTAFIVMKRSNSRSETTLLNHSQTRCPKPLPNPTGARKLSLPIPTDWTSHTKLEEIVNETSKPTSLDRHRARAAQLQTEVELNVDPIPKSQNPPKKSDCPARCGFVDIAGSGRQPHPQGHAV